jgi:hypothetical protein
MGNLELDAPLRSSSGVGWQAFTELSFIADMLVVLAMAVVLAAAIAYHPTVRAKASTLEQLEQPKTFIMYSMVGAITTIIVKTMPSMALVVFGIGGLLRFRTNVGEAKDTGRVILVTVIGLACGLELYVIAVLTTVLAWLLILVLERHNIERVIIQGLDAAAMQRVSEAATAELRELGCAVVGEDKRVKKGSLGIIYRRPRGVSQASLQDRLTTLTEREGAAVSWETT